MPVKRRKSKALNRSEIEAWGTVFESGFDFFQEVYLLTGLQDLPSNSPIENRAEIRRQFDEGAKEAWHRLGAAWLATYEGDNEIWALKQFGEP